MSDSIIQQNWSQLFSRDKFLLKCKKQFWGQSVYSWKGSRVTNTNSSKFCTCFSQCKFMAVFSSLFFGMFIFVPGTFTFISSEKQWHPTRRSRQVKLLKIVSLFSIGRPQIFPTSKMKIFFIQGWRLTHVMSHFSRDRLSDFGVLSAHMSHFRFKKMRIITDCFWSNR